MHEHAYIVTKKSLFSHIISQHNQNTKFRAASQVYNEDFTTKNLHIKLFHQWGQMSVFCLYKGMCMVHYNAWTLLHTDINAVTSQALRVTHLNNRFCYHFINTPLRCTFRKYFIKSIWFRTPIVFSQLQPPHLYQTKRNWLIQKFMWLYKHETPPPPLPVHMQLFLILFFSLFLLELKLSPSTSWPLPPREHVHASAHTHIETRENRLMIRHTEPCNKFSS